jgi:hypothetical protein
LRRSRSFAAAAFPALESEATRSTSTNPNRAEVADIGRDSGDAEGCNDVCADAGPAQRAKLSAYPAILVKLAVTSASP